MNRVMKWVAGGAIAIVAFLANPHGPLGGFWRPAPEINTPAGLTPFFLQLSIAEAVTFSVAVVLLVSAMPRKALHPLTLSETRGGFVALLWCLGNWWAHDSLHLHFGHEPLPLLFVEYGFHATMMVAAGYLLYLASKLYRK